MPWIGEWDLVEETTQERSKPTPHKGGMAQSAFKAVDLAKALKQSAVSPRDGRSMPILRRHHEGSDRLKRGEETIEEKLELFLHELRSDPAELEKFRVRIPCLGSDQLVLI